MSIPGAAKAVRTRIYILHVILTHMLRGGNSNLYAFKLGCRSICIQGSYHLKIRKITTHQLLKLDLFLSMPDVVWRKTHRGSSR